ncbi:flavonoid 3-O-glucosyltransferase-like [Humulus lupulus]|uniref:flavonoid 3-O-glucosyltransferase-like n=1 Tax=Humulus lupulus TaxID=3486 RepID=UPI002B40D4EE|nr:flavonoid 3-O-glucosyltransferase-like [Humulus lupulus]
MAATNNSTDPDPTRHVAVLAFPFGTHAGPLLSLVRELSTAAPDVKFSFLSTSRSNKALFSSESSERAEIKVVPFDVGDGTREGSAPPGNLIEAVDAFLNAVPENFERGLVEAEKVVGVKIGCVVSDAFFWFAGQMAGERRIPWVPLWTSGPRPLLSIMYIDEIRRRFGARENNKDEILDFLPGFSSFQITDLSAGIIIPPETSESPFDIMLHKMAHALPKANAVVINSFHQIDSQISTHLKTQFKKFLNVGPFTLMTTSQNPKHKYDSNGCLEWLSGHNPASVVYVSFGSMVTPHPDKMAVLAEALKASGFSFLWSYRGQETPLVEETLEGKLVSWAPQVEVLKHPSVGVFVTHCGWNSILESIVGGVPLICCPIFGDQMTNRRTIEQVWGIGVGVEVEGVMSKHGVLKALRSVLVEEEGKGMRRRIRAMKKLAFEAVDSVDGSSSKDFNELVEIITTG